MSLRDIEAARQVLGDSIYYTACPESLPLSELTGCHIYCKLDSQQRTGSFKERGARHALELLAPEQRKRGVVAASAGNHALGLAYHGSRLGIPVCVVMPEFAPLIKITTCRRLGARVLLQGQTLADSRQLAEQFVRDEGMTYIHGFDDPAIIAGQGTMGLEILEQVPDVEAVVVPVGGAGLLAGLAIALKSQRPEVKIYGVEPRNAASLSAALAAGEPVTTSTRPTLADGLAVPQIGTLAFTLAAPLVERVVTVDEDAIALAILRIVELEKGVVEGAAATPLAALLSGELPELRGRKVVLCLCGGNIDPSVLSLVIEKALAADGRLHQFSATISDRPGGLARFAEVVASVGAGIKQVGHERAFSGPDVSVVSVLCTVETRDHEHIAELHEALQAQGFLTQRL